jgi:hypothetical protein
MISLAGAVQNCIVAQVLKQKGRIISTWLTEAAVFHPHDSSGSTSRVPPERHLINCNELLLITPQSSGSSTKIVTYQEMVRNGLNTFLAQHNEKGLR